MPERTAPKASAGFLIAIVLAAAIAALVFFLALPPRHHRGPTAARAPFGPLRSVAEIRRNAAVLTGQAVRLRGRIVALRDLNPGQPFPWDVVYTLDDGTGTIPVHWFVQVPHPQALQPPTLPGNAVIVTGRVKRDLELNDQTYPLLIHEQPEFHNQEHPSLPAAPALR